ncbi:MAG: hypothetical protein JWQ44_1988 [Chthoniobacter sp.]|jgi:hypothetical protein|nr:hypothetical protein [Chthoniobacter sp.]
MKALLMLVLFVATVFAGLYYGLPSVREKARSLSMKPEERATFDAYELGKAIIRKQWPGDATVAFTPWGDDARIGARRLQGEVWIAFGRVALKLNEKPTEQAWVCVYNARTLALIQHSLGSEAEATLAKLGSGGTSAGMPPRAVADIIAPPAIQKATPKPGAWMFEESTALDRKPKPHR